jgi:hypothetical protein
MKRALAGAALLVVLATAFGGAGGQTASQFATQAVRRIFAFRFDRTWSSLHPALQRVTTRSFYLSCQRLRFAPLQGARIVRLTVVKTTPERISAPGIGPIDAVRVHLDAIYDVPFAGREHANAVQHVAKVDGRWRGLWTAPVYAAYKAGRCPAA